MKNFSECGSVERRGVAFESSARARPDAPRRVIDAVFNGASAAPCRIPPVVLSDQLLDASFEGLSTRARRFRVHLAPFAVELELIFTFVTSGSGIRRGADCVPHGMPSVILPVRQMREHRDGA